MDINDIVKRVVLEVQRASEGNEAHLVPTGVSNRHVHLSAEDLGTLFGEGAQLTNKKDLSQPGQFAAEECVTLVGPKGCIEKVRVLGPTRNQTQVEILASDCFKLGVKAPVKESGKLSGTPGIVIVGPKGCTKINEGVIVAQRHIHMSPEDAERFSCRDGEIVNVEFDGIRGGVLKNVLIRVSDKMKLDFHLDMDEANCLGIKDGNKVKIVK